MKFNQQRVMTVAAVALFACASFNVFALSVSGSTTLTYSQQQPAPIAQAEGNVLLAGEAHGINKNTGRTDYMDGASVTNQDIAQLSQGNGIHAGYFTKVTPEGSTVAKWDGKVTTVMKDGNPMTSFKGMWVYANGTGKYAGVKGGGEYTGYFTSKDTYVLDLKGDITMAK